MPRRPFFVLPLAVAAASCTSFASVRSAEVHPGPSVTVQASISTPPGDRPAWFWSFDCASGCDHPIGGIDVALALGETEGTPFTWGAGVNGILHPYVEGYVQAGRGERPYGVGARLGVPLTGWTEHQLYGRYDVPLGNGQRLLLNPGLFYHAGHSPNGENHGHFVALIQGVGLLLEGERTSVVPALSIVAGRGKRESFGPENGPFTSVFATASVNVSWHRRRAPVSEP